MQGIPLSQYDVAEVLMGFTVICVSILEVECGFGSLPEDQRRDMYHCWRLIGWHLGLLDEYNLCKSMEELEACFQDYVPWTPRRLATCRESTHELQRSVCRAFGFNTGFGSQWYKGLVHRFTDSRNFDVGYTRLSCSTGLRGLVRPHTSLLSCACAHHGPLMD